MRKIQITIFIITISFFLNVFLMSMSTASEFGARLRGNIQVKCFDVPIPRSARVIGPSPTRKECIYTNFRTGERKICHYEGKKEVCRKLSNLLPI